MKYKFILTTLAAILLIAGIAFGLAGKTPAAAAASEKIDPALTAKFAAEGTADFIVRFTDQADLSAADGMGWKERGEFVVNALQTAADGAQGNAKGILDAQSLKYQTFIAGNDLYVWAGNQATAETLAALPEVLYIRATRIYYIDPIVQNESLFAGVTWAGDLLARNVVAAPGSPDALAWGIQYTNADQFWTAFGLQGDGIKVANIDTGVQWNHPALDQAFACPNDPSNPDCWADPSNICGGSACDNNGHGSHTMGSMVGDDDPALTWQAGMAPNSTWIACKGCETNSCSDFALNACADWILQPGGDPTNRPHVVNNSWGGGGGDNWYLAKVQAWRAAGTFPAFSAGNAGSGCNTLGSPGDYQESFGSAAHDSGGNIASFSSRGPSAFGHDPYTKPNIAAPGVSVCSSVPTNGWSCGYSGTSMASPHSAGAVALLWSCNPGLVGQMDLTFQALQNTAGTPPAGNCGAPPDGEGNYTFGYGYLDILAAGVANCGSISTGALDGYVYDLDTGDPIEGATVTAVAQPGEGGSIQATTDPNGYYTTTLVVGTYDVTASKTNYTSQTVTGIVILTDTVTSQDFEISFLGAWVELPPLPGCPDWTRYDGEYYAGTGMVYFMGGRTGANTEGGIFALDPVAGSCSDTGVDMPVPISNYTIVTLNDGTADLLCTFGGRDSAGGYTNAVQCYDPNANSISQPTTLPAELAAFIPGGAAAVDNKAYVFGGFRNTTAPYETNDTFEWDPVADVWSQKGDLALGMGYIQVAVADGKIWAFGGDTFDGANLVAQTIAQVYDPVAGTWDDAAVADLANASGEGRCYGFDSASAYSLAGTIVCAGGGQWPAETAAAIQYDIASDAYNEAFADLNILRRNHAGVFVDGDPGFMWVFGGRTSAAGYGGDNPPYAPPEYFTVTISVPEAAIELVKTVGTDPLTCAVTDSVIVPVGTEVTYCYTVQNTGDLTLTVHDLVDSELGDLLTDFPYGLVPGASVYITETAVITQNTMNEATWTAWVDEVTFAQASDTAQVDVVSVEIAFAKTVGTDPNACATTDSITVEEGTEVTYCFEVTNSGEVTFTVHDLTDTQLGDLLVGFPYDLAPGASVFITASAVITGDVINSATWTAWVEAGGYMAEATDSASVTILPPAHLQVAHLAPFASDPGTAVTITLNGAPALTDFAYGDSTPYIDLDPGTYLVEVFPGGSATPAITAEVTLDSDMYYTAIATGDGVNQPLALLALVDDVTAPAAGNFKLRLGHLAPFAAGGATADVRLQDGTVILDDVDFGDVAPYLELAAGTYDLKITTPDGATTLIDPLPVTLPAGGILSAFATGEGVNQPLGVFALPSDAEGFFLPLFEGFNNFLPIVAKQE